MILPQKAAPDLRQPHGPGTTAVDTEPSRPVCFQKPHLWETTPAAASPVSPFPTERAKPWTQAGTPPRGLGRTPLPLMPAAQGALSSEAAGGCGAQAHQTSVGSRLARSLWPGRPAHVVALGASHVPTCRLGASFTPPLKNVQQEADTARPGVATDGLSSPTGLSASRPAACRDRVPAPHARCVRVGTAQVPPPLLPETGHPALHRPASCGLHLEDTASAASWAGFRSCRPSTKSSSRLLSPRHQMGVSVHTCVQWGTCTCSSCRAPGTDKETSTAILCSQPNNVASCRQKRGRNTTQHDTAWPTRNG